MSKGSPIAPFDNRQRRAILVFFMLCVIASAGVWLFDRYYNLFEPPVSIDYQRLNQIEDSLSQLQAGGLHPNQPVVSYHTFDPNTEDSLGLLQLGFTPRQARQLVNYRNKGGHFRSCDDMRKLYAMTPSLFEAIAPYCQLGQVAGTDKHSQTAYQNSQNAKSAALEPFDINQADSAALDKVALIGPVSIERILRYRQRLGGFLDTSQLREAGLSPEQLTSLKASVFVAADFEPRKLYLNRITETELRQHPYISYKQIRLLLGYRKQHGPYRTLGDVAQSLAFSEADLLRLKPYLSLEY